MKYIKTYEALEVGNLVRAELARHINWRMIEDVKDMSLEYLDDGFYLRFVIVLENAAHNLNKIYTIVHSHNARNVVNRWETSKLSLGAIENITDDIKIIYNVTLHKNSDNGLNLARTKALVSRASEAYPHDNFESYGLSMKYLQ